ncbi:hypothetical protein Mapa_005428 [Marchantia paleacea]|nr:hypothetical protein Mapa_005428 [Marchantia paleacea]
MQCRNPVLHPSLPSAPASWWQFSNPCPDFLTFEAEDLIDSGAILGSPNGRSAGHSIYRSLLASRSDSSRVRMSPSRTGPLTFLMMRRFWSSKNFTRTWVTCPLDPVRPITFITIASFTWVSMVQQQRSRRQAGGDREQQDGDAPCTNL